MTTPPNKEKDPSNKEPHSLYPEGNSTIPYSAAIDEILTEYLYGINKHLNKTPDAASHARTQAKAKLKLLLTAARSDWVKEVEGRIDAISLAVNISQGYSAEDVETIVGGNINRIKAEVKQILKGMK